ncbi:MAG TPA: tetratricopeptide repeat protein, partial [Usitatibacter sp.]|nr:tetratricopeptide repeat protein [Usitatibacter sp.]
MDANQLETAIARVREVIARRDFESAERDAMALAAAAPHDRRVQVLASAALWRRARRLEGAGRLLDAIDAYRDSLSRDDIQADKWNDLGNALANAAMLAEAHEAYREALKRNPAYHQVESNL